MAVYRSTLRGVTHTFPYLRTLLAKATPARSGDQLAGLAAANALERVAALLPGREAVDAGGEGQARLAQRLGGTGADRGGQAHC